MAPKMKNISNSSIDAMTNEAQDLATPRDECGAPQSTTPSSDWQSYLDKKFHSLQLHIDQKFAAISAELSEIKESQRQIQHNVWQIDYSLSRLQDEVQEINNFLDPKEHGRTTDSVSSRVP